ncbi:MAG: nitroreductase family protein [Phycisphaerales bacterium]|jgi:nitroreductase|nr:nitroreductase family protein [Phycisphaerales bacterium]MBT7170884.1 nitroreductase family protein [Phycisphaerales bacterium]
MLDALIQLARTYRRFDASYLVDETVLLRLVNLARLSPSSGNKQAIRFAPVNDPADCDAIFESLLWAYSLPDWPGPAREERPTAYIVLLRDDALGADVSHDAGIAAWSMVLGATERGLGACIFASADQDRFRKILSLPPTMSVELVLAVGKPVEEVVLEEMLPGESFEYWRDEANSHHVPKRRLEDVLWNYEQDTPNPDN